MSTKESPKHTYKTGGDFTVKMIVANETSVDSVSKIITVISAISEKTELLCRTWIPTGFSGDEDDRSNWDVHLAESGAVCEITFTLDGVITVRGQDWSETSDGIITLGKIEESPACN